MEKLSRFYFHFDKLGKINQMKINITINIRKGGRKTKLVAPKSSCTLE